MSEKPSAPDYDSEDDAIDAARSKIDQAIREFIDAVRDNPDAGTTKPYVQAWAVAVEWTSVELEQKNMAGRDVIVPDSQLISTSAGLSFYAQQRFGHSQ